MATVTAICNENDYLKENITCLLHCHSLLGRQGCSPFLLFFRPAPTDRPLSFTSRHVMRQPTSIFLFPFSPPISLWTACFLAVLWITSIPGWKLEKPVSRIIWAPLPGRQVEAFIRDSSAHSSVVDTKQRAGVHLNFFFPHEIWEATSSQFEKALRKAKETAANNPSCSFTAGYSVLSKMTPLKTMLICK